MNRISSMSRRTFLRNSALITGTLTGSSILLSACGGTAQTGSATLTVMFDDADTLMGKSLFHSFEHTNNCKITVLKFDQLRLNASIAAKRPPDIVRTEGASEMPNLSARGLTEPLDSYFQKSTLMKVDDLDPIVNVYRFDGKTQGKGPIYGFPIDYSQDSMVWFNKKLFDQAKVPYLSATEPLSYDQLLETGKKLTVLNGSKIQIYGLDAEWGFVNQGQLIQMIAQQGASLWNNDFTKADFTQPAARKVLQWFVDWSQAHVGPSPLDPAADWSGPIYNADRMAMVTYGYWFNAWINGTDNGEDTHGLLDRSGFVPAPQMGSTRIDACRTGTGAWIPKASTNKDLAFKFMEYWFGGEPAKNHFKGGAGLPGLKSLRAYLPHEKPTDKAIFDTVQSNLPYLSVLRFSPYANKASMEAAIADNIEPVMKGQVSLDTGIQLLQKQVDDIVRQGREQLGA